MTEQGKYFINEYNNGRVLNDSMQILYEKGHITKEEFKEVVGTEPKEKQIDICPEVIKTNKELQEENEMLKKQIDSLSEMQDFYEECVADLTDMMFGEM